MSCSSPHESTAPNVLKGPLWNPQRSLKEVMFSSEFIPTLCQDRSGTEKSQRPLHFPQESNIPTVPNYVEAVFPRSSIPKSLMPLDHTARLVKEVTLNCDKDLSIVP